ncbi:hypothetical protein [Kitasatospora nipponensis]|uniref:hypothetical protein n=1 Tax=Kitasatospora nipponensis TaxID=258049 RepID=UPI0031DF2438
MTVLKRALGTTLAAGALLLTVGALPAGAQAAVTGHAVFVGNAFSNNPYLSNSAAINSAYAQATAAGYTTATQCSLTHAPIAIRISPTIWQSMAQVTCNPGRGGGGGGGGGAGDGGRTAGWPRTGHPVGALRVGAPAPPIRSGREGLIGTAPSAGRRWSPALRAHHASAGRAGPSAHGGGSTRSRPPV